MELLDLIREAEELDEGIKEQRREFNLKIKEEVEAHKSKKKAVRKFLKEAIESREYEYKEITIKSYSVGTGDLEIYYPFLKLEDSYEIKEETFVREEDSYYEGSIRKYVLYNKNNGLEVKIRENAGIKQYKRGTNERYYLFSHAQEPIFASKNICYVIEIGQMKCEFSRSFDVSKI